jgi:hypothetical protein
VSLQLGESERECVAQRSDDIFVFWSSVGGVGGTAAKQGADSAYSTVRYKHAYKALRLGKVRSQDSELQTDLKSKIVITPPSVPIASTSFVQAT